MHCSCIHTPITWRGLSLSFVADYIRTYEQFGTREFASMYKHGWTHAEKMGQEKIQCKAYTLISFTTSTPGMRHDTQYWGNKKSCYWIPLGFTTLSGSCQVFLTHKMLVEINLKYDAQFTHMFLHALLLHPHFNYLEGPGFEFRGWLHQDLRAVWYERVCVYV